MMFLIVRRCLWRVGVPVGVLVYVAFSYKRLVITAVYELPGTLALCDSVNIVGCAV
jgi:hypothetical protein